MARNRPDPVTITGDVIELVLFFVGREQTRALEFEGPEASGAAVRTADLGA